jgi:hypothetical protein
MATVDLPRVNMGNDDKQNIQNLYDAYYKLRKELEFLLENLDGDNIDGKYIKKLIADFAVVEVVVTNTLVTQNLYADLGNIARLTVDRLLTSNILDEPNVMEYIDIKDKYMVFVKAVKDTEAEKVQYENEAGEPLYYKFSEAYGKDIITTEVTDNPVMVYQYTKYEKFRIYYETAEGVDTPVIVWGTGNGTDHGIYKEQQAIMYKDDNGFLLKYIQDGGNELTVELGENGVKINGSPYHKITAGTAAPSGGNDGDIYFRYTE